MSALIGVYFYYRLKCHDCGTKVETKSVQYERCPTCGSQSVTSARAERMESYDAEADQAEQRAINQALAKQFKRQGA